MDNNMLKMLSRALLGNGMAGKAADTINLRNKYTDYAIDEQSKGNQPIPFEQWAAEFMGQNQPQPQPQNPNQPLGGIPGE